MTLFDRVKKTLGVVDQAEFDKVIKKLETYARTTPPDAPFTQGLGELLSKYEYTKEGIYNLARNSDIILLIHKALRGECFRNGFEILEAENTSTDITDSEEETEPDESGREKLLSFTKKANTNNESLKAVMQRLEDDVNTIDQQFALFAYDYLFDQTNNTWAKKFVELTRANPQFMAIIADRQERFGMNDQGQRVMFDPRNRSQPVYDQDFAEDGYPLFPAWYKNVANAESPVFYAPWEIWYERRYRKELLTGYSPLISCQQKIFSLYYQDKYIRESYENGRPPKGLLLFLGVNPDRLQEAWAEMVERARENPNLPAVLAIPPAASGNVDGKFLDFMKTLDEMQHGDVRDEMRRVIGAIFGVSPVFENDISTSGGLNNEGLQITVTNRAVADAQEAYNDGLLARVVEALGVSGWSLRLRPSEEQDEMARMQRQEISLRNGELAVRLGLEAEYDDNSGEVIIKSGPLEAADNLEDPFGGEDLFDEGGDEPPGDDQSPSGSPDVSIFKSKKKLVKVHKALPDGAISIGSGEAPDGWRVVSGPKGGRYAVPPKKDASPEDSEGESGVTEVMSEEALLKKASELYESIPEEERKEIEAAVDAWKNQNDTYHLNRDAKGTDYTPERKRVHEEKVFKPYQDAMRKLSGQNESRVVFMAGLPASGKTTATKRIFEKVSGEGEVEILQDASGHQYMVLNADDVKGMLPEYNGRNAALVHEESSDLNKKLIRAARMAGVSIVIDGVMSNTDRTGDQLADFESAGYRSQLIHVDVAPQNALDRAMARYERSGRFVPFEIVVNSAPKVRAAVDALKARFGGFQAINNDGSEPVYE